MSERNKPRVLMIYPRFSGESFWNFAEACELVGAQYPAAPLGLITVAALLPQDWDIRLVNRNTETLHDADLDWADMVMTGGMLFQQADALALIDMCRSRGKPVVVGGPDVTSSPQIYAAANFRVLGEAESILDKFVEAWNAGAREGYFEAEKFQADVTKSPIPRFDLLKFDHYLYIGVQFSRGCPFTCEFCDIIELYGRVPRTKTNAQMLAELDALYRLGYRGHVDFVDDNLIGNKKSIKAFLPFLAEWLESHNHPFEFSTEASVNLADDAELLQLMREANFFAIFVGIESPDPETLAATRKKQNTRRSLPESIHRIYNAGMYVMAGFIVGFDTEKLNVADAMVELIEDAAIPVCMVGLLFALPNTQLTRRLIQESRLHVGYDVLPAGQGDQCSAGLNFETLRPREEIMRDCRDVLARIYDPVAYCRRLERLTSLLNCNPRRRNLPEGDVRHAMGSVQTVYTLINSMPEHRELLWKTFTNCLKTNPNAVRSIVMLMALFLHLGPFARKVVADLDRQIATIEREGFKAPPLFVGLPAPAARPVAAAE